MADAMPPIDTHVLADALKGRPDDAVLPAEIEALAWRTLQSIGSLLKSSRSVRCGTGSVERQRGELIAGLADAELACRRFADATRETCNG